MATFASSRIQQLIHVFNTTVVFEVITTFELSCEDIEVISHRQFRRLAHNVSSEFEPKTAQVLDCATIRCKFADCFFCSQEIFMEMLTGEYEPDVDQQ